MVRRIAAMYIPEAFREDRLDVLHDLIREHSFGALVTTTTEGGPFATHLPFLLDRDRGPVGTLRGHLARANEHWHSLEGAEALVIFAGPHSYITPTWYTTPVAVPTWNYVAIHAYGRPRLIQDGPELRRILDDTIAAFEARFTYQWQPPQGDYVPTLMRNVVGFEIELTRLEGKAKLSQNRSRADQTAVVAGLRGQADAQALAVADLMAARLVKGSEATTARS